MFDDICAIRPQKGSAIAVILLVLASILLAPRPAIEDPWCNLGWPHLFQRNPWKNQEIWMSSLLRSHQISGMQYSWWLVGPGHGKEDRWWSKPCCHFRLIIIECHWLHCWYFQNSAAKFWKVHPVGEILGPHPDIIASLFTNPGCPTKFSLTWPQLWDIPNPTMVSVQANRSNFMHFLPSPRILISLQRAVDVASISNLVVSGLSFVSAAQLFQGCRHDFLGEHITLAFSDVGVAFSAQFMSAVCNKCGQGIPHGSDSWCLGCSALEALEEELRAVWSVAGYRSLCHDLLSSAVRQTRALRRLSVASAGSVRASASGAGGTRAPSQLRPAEPAEPPRAAGVPKEGEAVKDEEAEEESSSESEEEEEPEEPKGSELHPGAAAKVKAEDKAARKERSRQRSSLTETTVHRCLNLRRISEI